MLTEATGSYTRDPQEYAARQTSPPKKQPSYSEAQAAEDARTLWEATEGGFTGWGTDEDAIWRTLDNKSAQEIAVLSRAFKDNYGRGLQEVLDGELSGADKDHAHALLQGKEHRGDVDAVRVKAEIDGAFGNDQEILKLIESRHGRERSDLALAFAARNGGPSNERAAAEFLLNQLENDADFSPDDMARARALLLPDGGDIAKGDARAAAAKVKVAVDGVGTDEQTLKDTFAGKTPEQIAAIQAAYKEAYGHDLRERMNEELSGSDLEQVMHLLDPASATDASGKARWSAEQDAMRIHEAVDGAGTDEEALRSALRDKSPAQIKAISAAYEKQYGVALRSDLEGDLGGAEAKEILQLLDTPDANDPNATAAWQATQDAHRLRVAIDGAGTDEDAIREILGNRSKAEVDAIAHAYKREYGEDLRSGLDDDLDGRDQVEMLGQLYDHGAIDFESDPRAAASEQVRRSRELQAYEGDNSVIDFGQKVFHGDMSFETDSERLDRTLDRSERALQSGDVRTATRYAGFSEQNVRSLVATKDSAAEGIANGAAIIAATATTIATAGSASPLMVIALSGTIGGVTAGGTYAALNRQAGADEVVRQTAIATASSATGAVPIGRGGSLAATVASDTTQVAARGAAVRSMAREGAWIGGQNGLTDGVARTATESDTWKYGFGNGLQQVAVNGVVSGTTGALSGALTGAAMSPLARARPTVAPDAPPMISTVVDDAHPDPVEILRPNLRVLPTTPRQLELEAAPATPRTLKQIGRLKQPLHWRAAERHERDMYGAVGKHFRVPGTGGRHVDVLVRVNDSQLFAGEAKSYKLWITRNGGPVRNEVRLTPKIAEQIRRDVVLRNTVDGYDPRWIFTHAPPSDELRQALRDADIIFLTHHESK